MSNRRGEAVSLWGCTPKGNSQDLPTGTHQNTDVPCQQSLAGKHSWMNCLPGEYTGPAPQEHRCDYHQDKDWKVGRSLKKKKKKVSQVLKCVCVSLSFHSPTQRLTSAAHLRILRNLGVSDPVLVRISVLARVLSSYLKIYMCIRVETWSCVFVLKILGMTISH